MRGKTHAEAHGGDHGGALDDVGECWHGGDSGRERGGGNENSRRSHCCRLSIFVEDEVNVRVT